MKILFFVSFTLFVTSCESGVDLSQFTDNSKSKDLFEFKAFSLKEAENTCDSKTPEEMKKTMKGNMEASCDYNNNAYSCICVLKLLGKNQASDKQQTFYLKKEAFEEKLQTR